MRWIHAATPSIDCSLCRRLARALFHAFSSPPRTAKGTQVPPFSGPRSYAPGGSPLGRYPVRPRHASAVSNDDRRSQRFILGHWWAPLHNICLRGRQIRRGRGRRGRPAVCTSSSPCPHPCSRLRPTSQAARLPALTPTPTSECGSPTPTLAVAGCANARSTV